MSGWDDLVTTALLGTGRRVLPESLPPAVGRLATHQADAGTAVLDAAAAYAGYLSAGARPGSCPVPDPAPRQVVDLAPEPAQTLLRRLLDVGDPGLVDAWLADCADRGLGVRAGLWTVLATAAARPTGPDRSLVRAALGQRGVAFMGLNPAWRSVLLPARAGHQPGAAVPTDDPVQAAQWLGLLPGPWSLEVTDAGLRLLGAGLESRAGRRLGLALGHRAPLSTHEQALRLAGEGAAHAGLAEAAQVLSVRVAIRQSFSIPTEETP